MVNVVMPNLLASDIAIVYPMSSMSGYLNYLEYTTGNEKGEVADNALIANPWKIGDVTTYTGQAVTQAVTSGTSVTLAWYPIEKDAFKQDNLDGTSTVLGTVKLIDGSGNVSYLQASDLTIDSSTGAATFTPSVTGTAAYKYNNTVVPQAKLPMLKAEMKSIPLLAHARRIAVYYSQIAAFQA